MTNNFDFYGFTQELKLRLQRLQDINGAVYLQDVYDVIVENSNDLLALYKPYLEFVSKSTRGQVNPDSQFGGAIKSLLSSENLSMLEFGTWNGLGSTKLCAHSTRAEVYSVELNSFMIATSIKNLQPFPSNLNIVFGKILNPSLFKIDLRDTFFSHEFENPDILLGALIEVILIKSAPYILDLLPSKVDCLLLDGGGFMTFNEFLILQDRCTRYLCLDDIDGVKSRKIFDVLVNSSNWILKLKCTDRAAAIFQRIL